jgi:hypothetical protein
MLTIDAKQRQIIKRTQGSAQYFISQFCWLKHPKLGPIKFSLFRYQSECLLDFLTRRYLIFWKTRQAGISTLVGAYALWYAMFAPARTVLIVSKRDLDAKEFLTKNVKFAYDKLPSWMQAVWPRVIDNEHVIGFPNGSKITSLSSSKDTLRSNSASLVVLDEVAHMPNMDEMWSAGAPTLQHAGQCICIGTPNGIGNWYWQSVTDAQEGYNDFKLIKINWWDMDWRLEHDDPVTGFRTIIAPTDDIRETVTDEERKKYGKLWSPWLEEQYRVLTQRGDDRKFRQEVLAEFLGSGNTVVSTSTLTTIKEQHSDTFTSVGNAEYVNPSTEERTVLEFDKKFWIWKKPVRGTTVQPKASALREIHLKGHVAASEVLEEPHVYVAGVDTSTGDGSDFCAVVVWDVTEGEQVAELKIRVTPRILAMMADYIGRYYNNALLVVERTGIGATTVEDLENILYYPNLYRPKKSNGKMGKTGFNTSPSSKPLLNKAIVDNIGTDGFKVNSFRLYKELCIYVHLSGGRTGNEPGTGNTDDLVMAAAMGLIGINEAAARTSQVLPPFKPQDDPRLEYAGRTEQDVLNDEKKKEEFAVKGGPGVLMPYIAADASDFTAEDEYNKFVRQLGGVPMLKSMPTVTNRKHVIR